MKTSRWRNMAIVGSAALWVAILTCHLVQPDWLAAVTIVPAWCWVVPGIALAAFGYKRNCRLFSVAVLAAWVVFLAVLVEETRSLLRVQRGPSAEWKQASESGEGIRVVSLNCGAGQADSAREVAQWKPDIVLLQESPSRESVEQLTEELFGATGVFLHGEDTSIATRGRLHPKQTKGTPHFVHAEVKLPSGVEMDVLSVRLAPPVFRLDFWTPGFWIDHRDRRIEHRVQTVDIMQQLESVPASHYVIVGGDFNSPPGDDALAPLKRRLFDTFRRAGRGWGATGTNEFPLFRVDQIWVSHGFRAESVTARKTRNSDHRMVVCDLLLEK